MKNTFYNISMTAAMIVMLAACSNDEAPVASTQVYSISITNLTNAQPLSPPIAILHDSSLRLWDVGSSASIALETMAEDGDGSALLALAKDNPQYLSASPLAPGETVEFTLETTDTSLVELSIAGMLVNTNDAFSGLNAVSLKGLNPGDSEIYLTHAYDAGTELNSEAIGTIPGPADGGKGFNAARDDVTSVVTFHSGVVSASDGVSGSALSEADKFDNPVLRIVISTQ